MLVVLIFVLDHYRRVRLIRPSNAIQPAYYRVTSTHQLIFESFRVLRLCTTLTCRRSWGTLARTRLLDILDGLHETGTTSDTLILWVIPKPPKALSKLFHMWTVSIRLRFLTGVRPGHLWPRPPLSSPLTCLHRPMASQAKIIDGTMIAKCVMLFVS